MIYSPSKLLIGALLLASSSGAYASSSPLKKFHREQPEVTAGVLRRLQDPRRTSAFPAEIHQRKTHDRKPMMLQEKLDHTQLPEELLKMVEERKHDIEQKKRLRSRSLQSIGLGGDDEETAEEDADADTGGEDADTDSDATTEETTTSGNGSSDITPNFYANYSGTFQHILSPHCEGPPPMIQALCLGGIIEPLGISDETIQCQFVELDAATGIQCVVDCDTASGCDPAEVYVADGMGSGAAGEVLFSCSGETPEDTTAILFYAAGDPGSCTADTSEESQNVHAASLAVFCPDPDNAGQNVGISDANSFECGLLASSVGVSGAYFCAAGLNCEGAACDVEFNDVFVEADVHNFYECIEAADGVEFPAEPTDEELAGDVPAGTYAATFAVTWQLALDLTACAGDFAPKQVTCKNGNIALAYVLNDNVECISVDSNTMECTDTTPDNFVNDFNGAVFNCTSENALPDLEATYVSAPAYCEVEDSVGHVIQMGIFCALEEESVPVFLDYLFECGSDSSFLALGGDHTCVGTASFGSDELGSTNRKEVGDVIVHTDYRWASGELEFCYTHLPGDGVEPPAEEEESTSTGTPEDCDNAGLGIGLSNPDCPEEEEEDSSAGTTEPEDAEPAPTTAPLDMDVMEEETPAPTVTAETEAPTETPVTADVNPSATYFTDYKARFKRVIDDGCEGPSQDTAVVICDSGELEILGTSDPSIICTPPDELDGGGQRAICQTTCSGDECDTIYVDRESLIVFSLWILDEELYAEIDFRCSSPGDVNGVDGTFVVIGSEQSGETGSCTGEGTGSGQNLLLAELNPLCGDEYVNDDAYAECEDFSLDINNRYTCLTGEICRDASCAVTYLDTIVYGDHHRFQECIQSDDGSGIPEPDEPVEEEQPSGQYTARFQVGSGFWYDEDACEGRKTGLKVECVDGDISLVSSDPDKSCEVTGSNTIECQELATSVVNEHVDVVEYDCTSLNMVPQTRAEYFSTDVECDSTSVERATRWLNMGVLCGDPGDETYASIDYFFECGKDNSYDRTTDDSRFSCMAQAVVPEDSAGQVFEIGVVEAYTDYRWAFFSSDRCYNFKAGTTTRRALSIKEAVIGV